MTTPGAAPHAGSDALFDALIAEVMARASRFGHREHVHLTWLAVRRCGVAAAVGVVGDGIQRTARYAPAHRKNTTRPSAPGLGGTGRLPRSRERRRRFAAFTDHHRVLLDKRLLTRFYRSATLASAQAKTGWAEPDLAPFPWQDPAGTTAPR